MWSSMEDVIQDLSLLNDFGEPGNVEPYKKFYPTSKKTELPQETKKKSIFMDTRTGEPIVFVGSQNKERGYEGPNSAWLRSLRTDLELQNQLKWVRRVRPNDDEVEHYFNKNADGKKEVSQFVHSKRRIPVFGSSSSSSHHDTLDGSENKSNVASANKNPREIKNAMLSTLIEKDNESKTNEKNGTCFHCE